MISKLIGGISTTIRIILIILLTIALAFMIFVAIFKVVEIVVNFVF